VQLWKDRVDDENQRVWTDVEEVAGWGKLARKFR
jgi:hypothetical protein